MLVTIWLSTGTMTQENLSVSRVLRLTECNYVYNIDHPHFLGVFQLLDSEPGGSTLAKESMVARRALHAMLAFPFYKMWGFEIGVVLFNFVFYALVFLFFVRWVRVHWGESPAIFCMWLLGGYPGLVYWGALPYSYAMIIPCSLLCLVALYSLESAVDKKKIALLSLFLGVLALGYDILPFFGTAALLILVLTRRTSAIPFSIFGLLAPSLAWSLILKYYYELMLINPNTEMMVDVVRAYFHAPVVDWNLWKTQIEGIPSNLIQTYLSSNFLFLPWLFLGLVAINWGRNRVRFLLSEKLILCTVLGLYLFINFSPPFAAWIDRKNYWEPKGILFMRIYQPIFVVFLLFSSRKLSQLLSSRLFRLVAVPAFLVVVAGNFAVGLYPITGNMQAAQVSVDYYPHGDIKNVPENLKKFGKRPIGFCHKNLPWIESEVPVASTTEP